MNSQRIEGYCPICERDAVFEATGAWFRDSLRCPFCNSVVRERALALVLFQLRPNWRDLAIHEAAPVGRGISPKLSREAAGYVATQYFPTHPFGTSVDGWRNEDLENQTFADDTFDVVITLDVMEHVFNPARVYEEVFRTLRPGAIYIHTFPIHKHQVESHRTRSERLLGGTVVHHEPEKYHGNPVDSTGSLVTFDYGYDIHLTVSEWAPFDVSVTRFCDRTHGLLGEYTEVIVCTKPGRPHIPTASQGVTPEVRG